MPVTITKSSSIQKNTGIFNLQFLYFFILHASKFGLRCSCFIHILSKKYFYPFQAPPPPPPPPHTHTYLPVVHTYACPYICKVYSHKVNHIKSYCQNFHTLKLDTDRRRRGRKNRRRKKSSFYQFQSCKLVPIYFLTVTPKAEEKSGGQTRHRGKEGQYSQWEPAWGRAGTSHFLLHCSLFPEATRWWGWTGIHHWGPCSSPAQASSHMTVSGENNTDLREGGERKGREREGGGGGGEREREIWWITERERKRETDRQRQRSGKLHWERERERDLVNYTERERDGQRDRQTETQRQREEKERGQRGTTTTKTLQTYPQQYLHTTSTVNTSMTNQNYWSASLPRQHNKEEKYLSLVVFPFHLIFFFFFLVFFFPVLPREDNTVLI